MKETLKVVKRIIFVLLGLVLTIVVAALLFLTFWPSIGDAPGKAQQKEYAAKTELFYDKQFHNENETEVMTGEQDPKSDKKVPSETIKAETPTYKEHAGKGELTYTWFGHSSFLLQLGDRNILVDPVLEKYASPVTFVGSKRFSECPVTVDSLPTIDVLFISHDHYDHLEYQTIQAIDPKTDHYIVPPGVDVILESFGISSDKITALYWWENIIIDGITYTLIPAQHYTGRNPLKANRTLWGGLYMNDGIHKVYYTGDTGYYDVFERVYRNLGSVDLLISEDGQYDNGWSTIHMMPEQVVQAAQDMHAAWLVPVHWGTFTLSNHAWDDPAVRTTKEAESTGQNVATPRIGQTVDYNSIADFTEHWWEELN